MDELNLLAALCGKRENYESIIRIGLTPGDFGDAGRCVVESAGEQYRRDTELRAVEVSVLRSQVHRRFGAGSMSDSVMEFVAGFPDDISGINVIEEYRLLRLGRVSTSLATLLATGQHGAATSELLAKYTQLASGEQGEAFKPRLTIEDFEGDEEPKIPISPPSLNAFIGGGVEVGNNVTVYGRPASAKTLFALNNAAFFCLKGMRVLYVANEEPEKFITRRVLARMTGRTVKSLESNSGMRAAIEDAGDAYENWNMLHRAGCTIGDITAQVEKIRPTLVVVDQIKNLSCKQDNRALQLDTLARQVRELGPTYNCITMSITQAGDSAHNKLVLEQNDVEWSNTGIPGASCLMVGLGVDAEFEATGKRMISIPRNKINGRLGAFHCWIDTQHTAFLSKKRVKHG